MEITSVVFDFGGVLVDWNPEYLYVDVFDDSKEMEYFLKNICTESWNLEQDKGRTLAEGTGILQKQYPEYHSKIQLFYDQWETMLKSDIQENVSLLYKLKGKYKLYGLTNWSAETFPIALRRFGFFDLFDGIVVSGQEKMIKPEKDIFHLLLNRYNLQAENSLFIDDNLNNINSAKEIGFHIIHYNAITNLEEEFSQLGLI
jgi:2-haloacid dehalogenase